LKLRSDLKNNYQIVTSDRETFEQTKGLVEHSPFELETNNKDLV